MYLHEQKKENREVLMNIICNLFFLINNAYIVMRNIAQT